MQKWQRRFWIAGVGLATTVLISVGILVGAFRLAVQLVPDYRADVETRVAQLFGTDARIQAMNLIWRGRYPTLQLDQVVLGAEGENLQFAELRIGFSLWRLIQGDLTPRRVWLSGTALQVKLQQGRVQLAGIAADGDAQPAPEEVLDQLYRIGDIELRQARVIWLDLDHDRPKRELRVDQLVTTRGFRGMEMSVKAEVLGQGRLDTELVLRHNPWRLERLALDLGGLDVWQDLQTVLPDFPALRGEIVALHLDSEWAGGHWRSAQLDFDLNDVGLVGQDAGFSRWRGSLNLTDLSPGVRGELQVQELVAGSGRWPEHLISAQWTPADEGWGAMSVAADYLRLEDLRPWLGLLPGEFQQRVDALQPAGELRELRLQASSASPWPQLTAELEALQLAADDSIPGVRGFSGVLSLDENGGRLLIDSRDLIVDAPQIFSDPLPVDELSGNLSWQRSPQGWRISAPVLHYAAMNLNGVGRLEMGLDERTDLDLELDFFCTDPAAWLAFQPKNWGKGLKRWLPQAVRQSKVASGQVKIRGDLADFPYVDGKKGLFRVALELEDTKLKFASDWPQVEVDSAELVIEGNGLSVAAFGNRIGGLSAERADARIPLLKESVLTLETTLAGDAADAWSMLRSSKLRAQLSQALDNLDISGRLNADLALTLPLRNLKKTEYSVTARFDRAALWTKFWPDPIQKIRGEVLIDAQGLRSHDLTASIAGLPLQANLLPNQGLTRIEAQLELPLAQLPESVPVGDWLRSRAHGSSLWRLDLQVGPGAKPGIELSSNLLGSRLDLPAPLGKTEEELRRISVRVDPAEETRVHVAYAQLLGFDALISGKQGLKAARVHFGPDRMPAGAPGWWVDGELAQAHLDQWLPIVSDLAKQAGQSNTDGMAFGGLVVKLGSLRALGQELTDVRLQITQPEDHWALGLSGPRINGVIKIPSGQSGERLRVDAQFARLNWAQAPGEKREAADPRQAPELHLQADEFSLNDVPLGRLKLDLMPVSRGLRIENLSVYDAQRREVDISGLWLRDEAGESAALEFAVDTRSFSSWLTALGYQDNIVARRGRVDGQLNWSPDPEGLSYSGLNGELRFNFSDGKLLNVEPGAGRVLGLFSVNALPRRFFLDFRDVVDTGLGFDSLAGKFSIAEGVADTRDLELKGPSLRIAARGTVDLARRLYDQTITIFPGLSSGVSLAATLLGGPVVGIFTVLAQELLDKPLDQVTQISYKLGGSWNNPEVSRLP